MITWRELEKQSSLHRRRREIATVILTKEVDNVKEKTKSMTLTFEGGQIIPERMGNGKEVLKSGTTNQNNDSDVDVSDSELTGTKPANK